MTWLYTLVFAGLTLTSSPADRPSSPIEPNGTVPAAIILPDETERFDQTYPLNAGGRVSVSNVNGSVTIEAWDRNEVKLEYVKTADTKERLSDLEIRIDSRADHFSVEADFQWRKNTSDNRWRNGGKLNVEFRLMAPRGAVLNEIETVNGSVNIANFTNSTRVSAVNGSVTATNLRGTARLETVNGSVNADFERLENSSKINLETVNGRVNLLLPSDASATLRADSLNGSIVNDFGLRVRKGKYVGRDLYSRLGSGDAQIRLESVNGGLAINRRNDGKNPAPATDLLPQKEKDDEDWDRHDREASKSAKIDKDVAKAVKESIKGSAKAAADAQVALEDLGPEIARITASAAVVGIEAAAKAAAALNRVDVERRVRDSRNRSRGLLSSAANSALLPSVPRITKKSETFPVKGAPLVSVDAKGCSVIVRGWEKSEVQYSVTQFSDPRNSSSITMNESHTDATVNLKVENHAHEARAGNFYDESRRMRIEIYLPKMSNLRITSNGEVRVEGVTGDLQLIAGDEDVNVRDSSGTLQVTNQDGQVRIIGFRGDLMAKTADGEIRMDGDFSRIVGSSADGRFVLTLPENFDGDIETPSNNLTIEDLPNNQKLSDRKWRFGKGGRLYNFTRVDGSLVIQNRDLIQDNL
jgi:DUF4097 and DUF4098 domain-containing protein YvlB